MSDIVIDVQNLSKSYRLGEMERLYGGSFREWAMDLIRHPLKRLGSGRQRKDSRETLWAIKDVSFQVNRGDVLGVVGRNGAGKSTLLKILSRITAPTSGRAVIHGRMSSLLEVGTGFHPELTGRENIFLNGSILGMRRLEIKQRFDEIVAFSETEKFLDTPVKRYSSGMYLRLAFAVAAHLEPEILVVDEVLSVGDVAFQRKCIEKMSSVAKEGRTVLFVSHNTAAVQQLCRKCLWLDGGMVKAHADTATVYDLYLASIDKVDTGSHAVFPEDPKKPVQVLRIALCDEMGNYSRSFHCDQAIRIQMDYVVRRSQSGLYGYVLISREDGTPVLVSVSDDNSPNPMDRLEPGYHTITLSIPPRTLGHGRYHVQMSSSSPEGGNGGVLDAPGPVCLFTLDDYATLRGNRRAGYFSTLLNWDVRKAASIPSASSDLNGEGCGESEETKESTC